MNRYIQEILFSDDLSNHILVQYPSIIFSIVTVYILFVKWIGPALMRDRKPFDLKYPMIIYDFSQSLVNLYLTYQCFVFAQENWHHRCMVKHNPELQAQAKRLNVLAWQIYLVKIADLVDTVFFVLRKKDEQVSFLHVFHHALMCIFCCMVLKWITSGSMGFHLGVAIAINTTVHVIVYFYYGLAAFGPHMNKYLWWKKYLTQFQIGQFIVILTYLIYGWMTGCEDFGTVEISLFLYIAAIMIMFFKFYQKYEED